MRIAIVTDQFSEQMGYAENCLPRALAAQGHDVHIVASNAQVYSEAPFYDAVYGPFLGPALVGCGTTPYDGTTLHRSEWRRLWRRLKYIEGLTATLDAIKPDVVQSFDSISLTTVQIALHSLRGGYLFFTGNHTVASVYPAARDFASMPLRQKVRLRLADTAPGFVVAQRITTCYAATVDAADIATRFFGVPAHKVVVRPLGVDTLRFHPVTGAEADASRAAVRHALGVANDELFCIYTGRFTADKGPLVLAKAVAALRAKGVRARALFIGEGPTREAIAACDGAIVRPFMPASELPAWYRAADVGVWPRQESISMLDAAACGVPIVISDRVQARERVEGNGLTYVEEDVPSLMAALERLRDPDLRATLGAEGARKIEAQFSWNTIARDRAADYQRALAARR